ncbi:MAG: sulfite exporter TauE/SafE family protein [Deltaproteobacteria bacterium]|nr:sulfite exporter TauE/SafE family protein [Deltaproteobacteria bacterium]
MSFEYFLIYTILLLACFLHGVTGFGSALVALPLLAMILDVKTAIPLVVLVAGTMNFVLLIQLWPHVRWDRVRPLLIGALPGILLGVLFLKRVDETSIRLVPGAVLVVYAAYGLLFRPSARGVPEVWAYLFGFLAGGLGGAFSIIGPPVVAYVSPQPWDKHEVKAMLQGFFFLAGALVIGLYVYMGVATLDVFFLYLPGLPLLFLGWWLGSNLYGRIPEAFYRKAVLALLGCMGVAMVWQAGL